MYTNFAVLYNKTIGESMNIQKIELNKAPHLWFQVPFLLFDTTWNGYHFHKDLTFDILASMDEIYLYEYVDKFIFINLVIKLLISITSKNFFCNNAITTKVSSHSNQHVHKQSQIQARKLMHSKRIITTIPLASTYHDNNKNKIFIWSHTSVLLFCLIIIAVSFFPTFQIITDWIALESPQTRPFCQWVWFCNITQKCILHF